MNRAGCIGDCGEDVSNFHFADVMEITEEAVQVPVEWVDADEWEAIEQALAAATFSSHFTRNDAATG